ncbi:MAG: amino acid adenylation domain-containing protein, partial [Comamonadaceae bacterium]
GFRIELGEIEAALRGLPQVLDAVVLAREDQPGDKRLVAYLVAQPQGDEPGAQLDNRADAPFDVQAVREALGRTLPDYMVPAHVMWLSEMPLTTNGKLDRRALPQPDALEGQAHYVAPQTSVERTLARIWAEVLDVERVGLEDNFFALGGHSLLAVQLASRVRSQLGVDVMLAQLFANPSLGPFARVVEQLGASALPAVVARDRAEEAPLSFSQKRLWFLDQLDAKASLAHHILLAVRLRGALDTQALQKALDRIVERHEALRTHFELQDGEPVQRIMPHMAFSLRRYDLSAEQDPQARVQEIGREEAAEPFDLAAGPLVRGRLLRLDGAEHVLLATMHHIVSDGWSMGVLVREFGALYDAFSEGKDDPLPVLAIQYADYAVWQKRWLGGDVQQKQLAYWTRHLLGAPELIELPTDRARPAVQSHRGESWYFDWPAELAHEVNAMGQRSGATLFMALAAAFGVVLSKHAGQHDICIGLPTANRNHVALEPLIGFFVNTLVLRIKAEPSLSFNEVLAQVRDDALAAYAHQDLPFEQLVEAVNPSRTTSHAPIYQVSFNFYGAHGQEHKPRVHGLSIEPIDQRQVTVEIDMSVHLSEQGDGSITGAVAYNADLFDEQTIARMFGHYELLLRTLTHSPEAPQAQVGALSLLPVLERRQLLLDWNDTAVPIDRRQGVQELFRAHARRAAQVVALVFGSEAVTYAELDARANRLAHQLIQMGVQAETPVGIYLERSIDLVVSILAILKAGGAYVPLDPVQPADRLAYVVEDAGLPLIITNSVLEASAPQSMFQLLLDDQAQAIAGMPNGQPDVAVLADQLAYIIYTSGSTGQPKGVQLTHAGLANLAQAQASLLGVREGERVLQFAAFSFDASTWEIFMALTAGATLCLAPRDQLMPGLTLERTIAEMGVQIATLPPVGLAAMAPDALPSLHTLVSAGEACSYALASQWARGRRFINAYGPTEVTVCATAHQVTADLDRAPSIGRALDNMQVYVLDAWLQPQPVGVAGELYVAGEGLARGYRGRPDLTAARFLPNPYGAPGSRMYATGDLVRWLADGKSGGELEYLERIDHQVKIRGFRIELGEIEAALKKLPEVRNAVVIAREDQPGDKRLVAYAVAHPEQLDADGQAPDARRLREALGKTLPDYMVPSQVMWLQEMPLTPNGKVDQRALPQPDGMESHARYIAPGTAVEQALSLIWADILKVERVGLDDNFFALGGHSLLAVKLASRVRSQLGVELVLAQLFTHATLRELAQTVEAVGATTGAFSGASELPPVEPRELPGDAPLSFAQARLWFLTRLNEQASLAYHLASGVRLRGDLHVQALQRALDRIVERHEALRTHFELVNGEPVQRIRDRMAFPLEIRDLSVSGNVEEDARLQAQEEASEAFDLATGPLVRGRLLKLGGDEHLLLATMHHIVSDGWSMGVLIHEFSVLYEAFSQGRDDPLPPLQIQYADYAVWQRRRLTGDVQQRQLDYWTTTLSGAPELSELPTDRPRPAAQDHAGASVDFALDAALSRGVNALALRHGTTPFNVLLAAWASLTGRLSGQSDVVIGTSVANRTRTEVEPLIGFFVNTLALRIDLSGRPSVAELVARVHAATLSAQSHQDLPFEQVIEAVNPARSMAHSPLFQLMLAWQNNEEGELRLGQVQLQGVATGNALTKFDLSLNLGERDGCIAGDMQFATALYERASIERHLGYLKRLLAGMVDDETRPVQEIAVMPAAERQQVLHGLNDTAVRREAVQSVHGLFEAQAARTPDAVAVVFGDEALSYAQLNAAANRLAHLLIARGVRADVLVALCLERSIHMVVAMLAVLKAGGAYVPLDPQLPDERLAGMLEDCAPLVVLSETGLAGRLTGTDGALRIITLDAPNAQDGQALQGMPSGNPPATAFDPAQLAYCIYTSGSTGKPKGALNSHGAVVNRLLWMHETYGLDASDAVLQKTPYAFDVSVWEFYWPLLAGARLVVARPDGHKDPQYMAECITAHAVTTLHFVPSMLQAFLAAGPDLARHRLRQVFCSGEALPAAVARECLRSLPQVGLHNLYGPTEAAVDVTFWECSGHETDPVPLGRAIANVQMHVLDDAFEPAPLGAVGQLAIAGVALARGYLRRAGLTAEKFVPNPHGAPGTRMYLTGDFGRRRADGQLEYLGRIDHQVKIRGFRIELGEIEAALRALPDVGNAVVVAHEARTGDSQLVAYLEARAERAQTDLDTVRASLARTLPDYMLPSQLMWLAQMPLSANGKLDRKALPQPEALESGADHVAPRTALEKTLSDIWADVLKVERVGLHDNFFGLGGHSLLAVQLASHVRSQLGVEVELAQLFSRPTLAQFAQVVAEASVTTLPAIGVREKVGDEVQDAPLSFAQQRLWFLDRLDSQAALAYHMPLGVKLTGLLDQAALKTALDRIVERHEALRTHFEVIDNEPVQKIRAQMAFALQVFDLSAAGSSDEDAMQQVMAQAQQEAAEPFDLATGPLVRGRLLKLGDTRHVLLATMHHIVSDGWSLGVLIREFSALYDAFSRGHDDPLPPLEIQYADYAVWQRRWLAGDVLQRQLDYWKATLAGAPALTALPTDRPRPAQQDYSGDSVEFTLDRAPDHAPDHAPSPTLSQGVQALARRHHTTVFNVMLAAWASLVARLSRQEDVLIGTPVANRTRTEVEPLIGFFVNTMALRIDVSGEPAVGELIRRVHVATLAAQSHQDIPFEQVIEAVNPARSMAHAPLFQLMLAGQNNRKGELALGDVQLERLQVTNRRSQFDLSLDLYEDGPRITGRMEFATALFDRATIERHVAHLLGLLQGMVADDSRVAKHLPLMSDADRDHVLHAWNGTAVAHAPWMSAQAMFEAQALRAPDAAALVFRKETLSYGQLDAQANQLAHHLIAAGLRADTPVGICLDRSVAMIVSVLAVLKAGGAYVPLDPSMPASRLAHVIRDARIALVIAQSETARQLDSSLRDKVPGKVLVDTDAEAIARQPASRPDVAVLPGQLAYIIYTSGSTGQPKGVELVHAGLANLAHSLASLYQARPGERVLQFAAFGFDVATWEIVLALTSGATLCLAAREQLMPGLTLESTVAHLGVEIATLPPAVLAAMEPDALPTVHTLVVGGESCSLALAGRWAPGRRFFNAYGPTEVTVDAAVFEVPQNPDSAPPIGRGMQNTQLFVLDERYEPLPVGVPGQLYVAGPGLARGYRGRADQTADRFVPNPFGEPGSRMYATGDLARWSAEGQVEYLDRIDHQVKIRGFRIEPGEIEQTLRKSEWVRDAIVVPREDEAGDKQLVAYVVPADTEGDGSQTHTDGWRENFDGVYADVDSGVNDAFNLAGWVSSYDETPIPTTEMQEWVDQTVARIQALKPQGILEIGCGTGLLLHRLAQDCTRYYGSDISPVVISQLRAALDAHPYASCQVVLECAEARASVPSAKGRVDVVVVNSVAQYFPDVGYVVDVIGQALDAIGDGPGHIFLGDIRHAGLRETFQTSLALARLAPGAVMGDLRRAVERGMHRETELLMDPLFFFALQERFPQIRHVSVRVKGRQADNEMTRYRFDAVLDVNCAPASAIEPQWLDWNEWLAGQAAQGDAMQALAAWLASPASPTLALRDVPDALVARDVAMTAALYHGDEPLVRGVDQPAGGVDRHALLALCEAHGVTLEMAPATGNKGTFHAVFQATPEAQSAREVNLQALYPVAVGDLERSANRPATSHRRLSVAVLREFLSRSLPDYMVPAHLVELQELPLTPNGKVDRRALPAPDAMGSDAQYAAPRTGVERELSRIWAEVLKVERVGVNDNFFALGGHSLLATRVLSRIRQVFGVELLLRHMFDSSSLAELAREVDVALVEAGGQEALPIEARAPSQFQDAPLSFAQQRLWFLDRLDRQAGLAYHLPVGVRLSGALDAAALQAALDRIVARHEALRTHFAMIDGEPVQRIEEHAAFALAVHDLSGVTDARQRHAQVMAQLQQEAGAAFDLATGPLVRGRLLRLGEEDHVFVATMHHIVSDGWSMEVLIKEFGALYEAFSAGREDPLPPLAIQYADYAMWQRRWLTGDVLQRQLDYWKGALSGSPELTELPTDRARPPAQDYTGDSVAMELDAALSARLNDLAQAHGTTVFNVVLAAWASLVSRLSGQGDVVIGTPVANRTRTEVEPLIGFFVNTLALRIDLSGQPGVGELIRRV